MKYWLLGGAAHSGKGRDAKSAMQSVLSEDDIFDENQKILLGYQDDFGSDDN